MDKEEDKGEVIAPGIFEEGVILDMEKITHAVDNSLSIRLIEIMHKVLLEESIRIRTLGYIKWLNCWNEKL